MLLTCIVHSKYIKYYVFGLLSMICKIFVIAFRDKSVLVKNCHFHLVILKLGYLGIKLSHDQQSYKNLPSSLSYEIHKCQLGYFSENE